MIVCHTAREGDRPSTRVTLGVMNLGEEIRFSDGFLAAAQAAIKQHDVHLITGFLVTPTTKSARFARPQPRLEGMRRASHGGQRTARIDLCWG